MRGWGREGENSHEEKKKKKKLKKKKAEEGSENLSGEIPLGV